MKRRMTAVVVALLCVAAVVSLTPAAYASLSYQTNAVTTDWKALAPFTPNPIPLQLNQFDSTLGTLQEVTVILYAQERASAAIENGSANAAPNAYVSLTGSVKVELPAVTNATAPSMNSATVSLDPNGAEGGLPTYNSLGADYHDFGQLSANDSGTKTITSGLAPYIGLGTVQADVYGQGGWSFAGTTDAQMTISGFEGRGDVTLIYGYDVIPEPGVLGLAGLGIVALLYRRRLSRKG